ncbi:MAG: Crp/Fnr family transcriptional regulator [Flavobacterium sp.]
MQNKILSQIYQHPQMKQEDLRLICDAHQHVEFQKGDYFLEKGKIANEYFIIEIGLVRAFTHNYKGEEITTDFIGENEIVIEVSSLFTRIPAQESLQALTNGVAWKIDFNIFQELYHKSAGFSEWGRAWMSNQLFGIKQRNIDMISVSASDRYLKLLKEKPQIIQQASLKHIASFLGVTDTSLSRIRKEVFDN